MDLTTIINAFKSNKEVFKNLLSGLNRETYLWKPSEDKWCLLEIVCHLHDEERGDFRARVKHVLESPDQSFPPFDPIKLVESGSYMEQQYSEMVDKFLSERDVSIGWLASLSAPVWDQASMHPRLGPMSARLLLNNWLAHDYLHIRQITRTKYQCLQIQSGEDLSYAGTW